LSTSYRRSWLDGEFGFERTHACACRGNSAPKNLCRCGVRLLERRTELARRAVLVRSRVGSRCLSRAKFHQRRLFHSEGRSTRTGAERRHHKTFEWSDLEVLRAGWKSPDGD